MSADLRVETSRYHHQAGEDPVTYGQSSADHSADSSPLFTTLLMHNTSFGTWVLHFYSTVFLSLRNETSLWLTAAGNMSSVLFLRLPRLQTQMSMKDCQT